MVKTALIIDDRRGIEIFRFLQQCPEIALIGLADCSGDGSWLTGAEKKKYYVTGDPARVLALPDLEVVVNAASDPEVSAGLQRHLRKGIELVELLQNKFLSALLCPGDQFLETRQLKGELWTVLNSVQDAIEVVDAAGIIKYVNPAFSRVTGIPESKRVNRNIFEASPHGALAQALIRQKPVTGYRTYVGGSEVEVISNASPIIVDGEIAGAVVVFQPVSDILKLMDQLKHSNAIIENLYAQIDQISGSHWNLDDLNGRSKVFRATVEMARKAARSEAAVLISGESGTGKSVLAQAIYNYSSRKKRPMIVFDCASVPETVQELELFGCEKGALPGVVHTRLGKIELAHEGTLFLKDIGSLNSFLQEKLLHFLERRELYRIGGETPVSADAKVIVSASDRLEAAAARGEFHEALYRHLDLVRIKVPPLRKRREDIPLLVQRLLEGLNRKMGKSIRGVSPGALQELLEYDWPGNIGELKSVIALSMTAANGPVIERRHLAPYIERPGLQETAEFNEIVPLEKMEQTMLKLALARYGETLEGKKKAARALNISLATLYNKLKKYNGM